MSKQDQMTLFQWIKSTLTIPGMEQTFDLESWRDWLKNSLIVLIVLLAFPIGTITMLPVLWRNEHFFLVGMDLAFYIMGLIHIFSRGRTIFSRAIIWLLLPQLMAYAFLLYMGPHYARSAWLVVCAVLWAAFFGKSAAVFSIGANAVYLSVLYWLVRPDNKAWQAIYQDSLPAWIGYLVAVTMLSLTAGLAVGFLLNRLNHSLNQERTSKRKLAESEFRFRSLFNTSPNGIVFVDMRARILEANVSFLQMMGYHQNEMAGQVITEFVLPEYSQSLEKIINDLEGGATIEWPKGLGFRKADASAVPASVGGWPIVNEKGVPVAMGLYVRDTSLEQTLQLEKTALMQQLQQTQKMEAIGTLAGGIAHDFNNLLAGIIGYTELAEMSVSGKNGQVQGYLSRVLEAGRRAKELVQQILRFSRQEKSQKMPLLVRSVVQEVTKLLRSTLPKNIQIIEALASDEIMILADGTQIHQVIMNLCTNAYQAMREKGGTLTIALDEEHIDDRREYRSMSILPGTYAHISVKDTGHGISEENIEKIFDPYFTTKKVGEGTGLGLAVTLGIVKEHDGLVLVKSALGSGSEFSVFLPSVDSIHREIRPAEMSVRPGKHERVLVIDDERYFLDMVEENLQLMGYDVEGYQSSVAALARFKQASAAFELIISDQTMPEMSGLQLAAEIRRIRRDIPIILCTGYSDQTIENHIKLLNIYKLLMKPVARNDLAQVVCDALGANAGRA